MASKNQRKRKANRRKSHQDRTTTRQGDPFSNAAVQLAELRDRRAGVVDFRRDGDSFRVELDTSDITTVEGGLEVGQTEIVRIDLANDRRPPAVTVEDTDRFAGTPHVIRGSVLCIYLEPSREWHPTDGMAQVVGRTLEWFDNAANRRADPRTSLFHAVGGANPRTLPRPTVVMRCGPPADSPNLSAAQVLDRSANRIDIVDWGKPDSAESWLPAFRLRRFQPLGLPRTVGSLASEIESAGGSRAAVVVERLRNQAVRTTPGLAALFAVSVEHPTEPDLPCIVLGLLSPDIADDLRKASPTLTPQNTAIEWLPMSDERPETTTPRDSSRPASAFRDRSVELWGCGGLGSWIGEFAVRARPTRIVVRDIGVVTGGLLVRQNFTEADVGNLKAVQLAERLRSLADDVEVEVGGANALDALSDGGLPTCDLIVDATINETVAYQLDEAARDAETAPLLCQVATDRASATLGVVVSAQGGECGPASVEGELMDSILDDAALEGFHRLWSPPPAGASLTPAPGCSTPTYHGAAADVAAVAGSMASAIGQQLQAPAPGITLLATPMAGVQPAFKHVGYQG